MPEACLDLQPAHDGTGDDAGSHARWHALTVKPHHQKTVPPALGNGGFEEFLPPLPPYGPKTPLGCGWVLGRYQVERDTLQPYPGKYSLRIGFLGTANLAYSHTA
jgi:hypothetical protein